MTKGGNTVGRILSYKNVFNFERQVNMIQSLVGTAFEGVYGGLVPVSETVRSQDLQREAAPSMQIVHDGAHHWVFSYTLLEHSGIPIVLDTAKTQPSIHVKDVICAINKTQKNDHKIFQ